MTAPFDDGRCAHGNATCDECNAAWSKAQRSLLRRSGEERALALEEAARYLTKDSPIAAHFADEIRALASLPPTLVVVERKALAEALEAIQYAHGELDAAKMEEVGRKFTALDLLRKSELALNKVLR